MGVIIHKITEEASRKKSMGAVFIIVSHLTIMRFHQIGLTDSLNAIADSIPEQVGLGSDCCSFLPARKELS